MSAPALEARADRGLVGQCRAGFAVGAEPSAAEIFDQWHLELAGERHQFIQRRTLGETFDAEVRRMHAEDQRGAIG